MVSLPRGTLLASRFASQSKSRVAHLKRQLQTLRQGTQSCSQFLQTAKSLADQLAIVGKPVDDDDLISYLISVTTLPLDSGGFALYSHQKKYNPNNSNKRYSPGGSFKQHQHSSSPKKTDTQRFSQPQSSSSFHQNRPQCQICNKLGHLALDCYHKMDFAYKGRHPPAHLAAMAVTNQDIAPDHQTWLADSGANNHITADLSNLRISEPYHGENEVAVGNGSSLPISHTGFTQIPTNSLPLHLHHILHCPTAATNLLSIQRFCRENRCWFKLTADYFVVKDNLTGQILLQGPSKDGLYPIPLATSLNKAASNKLHAFSAQLGVAADLSTWHFRLGHPASQVVNFLKSKNQVLVKGQSNSGSTL
ncbi:hypothetical protein F0562_013734 [Nyssa sinensis]|uniref:Retrovirus-related Pol polyprotein from transposon TNT 1-94-like beta-barrel domain-containing protein n=1 Tax=Nyssa sinensis TaxID=561372 RepID=A0A5J4ZP84_9ASTE|nr:hypothetical protein F0562_013734 [Nyssa sinensis]